MLTEVTLTLASGLMATIRDVLETDRDEEIDLAKGQRTLAGYFLGVVRLCSATRVGFRRYPKTFGSTVGSYW